MAKVLAGAGMRDHKAKRRHARFFSFCRREAARSATPWQLWLVVGLMCFVAVLVVRSVANHDQLTQWRQELERQTVGFVWPKWDPLWPSLPQPRNAVGDLSGPYAFAATHSRELRKIPCFCGCQRLGHRSNADCYLRHVDGDGRPTWDPHSFTCSMCVRITREVALMLHQDRQITDIRREIDEHYREQYGNGTDTGLPNER